MPSLVVTFAFATDAQSFVATPGASSTLAWDGANGNPAGCLSSTITGRNKSDADKWARTLTFAAMGVPSGAVVNSITAASIQSRCTAYTTGAASTAGPVTLVDGATTITLAASRAFSATDAAFVTSNGVDASGLSLPATDNVTISINSTLATGASNTASVALKQDQLTFTVGYSFPTRTGSLAATETGADTASLAGQVAHVATLAAHETGTDAAALSVAVKVSANLAAHEAGADTAALAGTVKTPSGAFAAHETGTDAAALGGTVTVGVHLAASEAGADTFAGTGQVQTGTHGSLNASETGTDAAALAGTVAVAAHLAASETGADQLAAAGLVAILGAVAASEIAVDAVAIAGLTAVAGALVASEPGGDTAAFAGVLEKLGRSGDLVASEIGLDAARLVGAVGALNVIDTLGDPANTPPPPPPADWLTVSSAIQAGTPTSPSPPPAGWLTVTSNIVGP